MKKKEVAELMKKFYLFGGVPSIVGTILAVIMVVFVNTLLGTIIFFVGLTPLLVTTITCYFKAKKMEANACIKCPSPNKTKVSEDIRLPDETIDGVLCEIHRITHTCEDCGTEYTCIEYKRIKG